VAVAVQLQTPPLQTPDAHLLPHLPQLLASSIWFVQSAPGAPGQQITPKPAQASGSHAVQKGLEPGDEAQN
jgi:hypothetical protein